MPFIDVAIDRLAGMPYEEATATLAQRLLHIVCVEG